MNNLIILDLDNTLILGTSNPNHFASILFRFSPNLVIYERPNAREFVQKCHAYGDVAVYTTADREYAEKVCENLDINLIELFTREDCLIKDNMYVKSIPSYYHEVYDLITIIDDLPEVWDQETHKRCLMIQVSRFVGEIEDNELMKIEL
jgi:TFIIF-interacting CTD phosphatase-like protein